MKKIINGRRYDTQTAKLVGQTSYGIPGGLNYWWERLYRKRTGEFFLQGNGGPMSKYSERTGENEWGYGHKIRPLSLKEAQVWVEKHLDADIYEEIFGRVSEGKVQAATWVSEDVKGQIDDLRKEKGLTLVEIIEAGVKALSEK